MKITIVFLSLAVCSASAGSSRVISTEANATLLATAVNSFRSESRRLPTEEEGLSVLILKPSGWPDHVRWIPLLETTDLPRDSWGHEFVYVLDPRLPHGFGIYSCGIDGVTNSKGNDRDDINTWNPRKPWRTRYRIRATIGTVIDAITEHPTSFGIVLILIVVAVHLLKGAVRDGRQSAP